MGRCQDGAVTPLFRPGERRKAAPRSFVIGGLLACGEAMLLLGAPFAGKSALGVAIARSVSTGTPFFGYRVRRGVVVYVAAERYGETDMRLEIAVRNDNDPPVRIAVSRLYADEGEADRLAASVQALSVEVGLPPALIIFDTVNALLRDGSGDENNARDINKLTRAIDTVRDATGAAVLVIHHAKRGETRSRGSEALEGWAEVVAIADGKGEHKRLSVIRSNTIEAGIKANFMLRPMDLGEDAETGSRSSVVIAEHVDRAKSQAEKPQPIRLSRDTEIAFTELRKLPEPISLSEWRAATVSAYGPRKPSTLRQAFLSARRTLEEHKLISVEDQSVSVRIASE